jgi:tripartite-type tricarboxylate transporter receptor subunit TctC
MNTIGDIARLTAAPPTLDKDILETLRTAYRMSIEDPQLKAMAAKANLPLEPLYGEDVSKAINLALNPPAHIKSMVRETFERAQ